MRAATCHRPSVFTAYPVAVVHHRAVTGDRDREPHDRVGGVDERGIADRHHVARELVLRCSRSAPRSPSTGAAAGAGRTPSWIAPALASSSAGPKTVAVRRSRSRRPPCASSPGRRRRRRRATAGSPPRRRVGRGRAVATVVPTTNAPIGDDDQRDRGADREPPPLTTLQLTLRARRSSTIVVAGAADAPARRCSGRARAPSSSSLVTGRSPAAAAPARGAPTTRPYLRGSRRISAISDWERPS